MALLLLASVGGLWLAVFLLKDVYARQRPEIVAAMSDTAGMSFPSGHAMVSAALYPTLAVLVASVVHRLRLKLYLVAFAAVLAIVVGLTRLYLGVHYPTDVLAGWALGFAWAALCGILARTLQRRRVVERPAG